MPGEQEPQTIEDGKTVLRKLTGVRSQMRHLEETKASLGTSIANLQQLQDDCDKRLFELGFMENALFIELMGYPDLVDPELADPKGQERASNLPQA